MVRSTSIAEAEHELALELDIAEFLAEKPQPRARAARRNLPRYDERRGWCGGDGRTLYAIEDERTGSVTVRPAGLMSNIGPAATVRVATRAEAERLWQSPLPTGWKVA